MLALVTEVFQSTPSVGRATLEELKNTLKYFISIHALRGEGDPFTAFAYLYPKISIHALRGEGDGKAVPKEQLAPKFQSTPSVGRATKRHSPISAK